MMIKGQIRTECYYCNMSNHIRVNVHDIFVYLLSVCSNMYCPCIRLVGCMLMYCVCVCMCCARKRSTRRDLVRT